jgi:lipopolysaccharide transport system ATP-binding protein
MRPAICVEDLAKLYRVGILRGEYRTLREAITDAAVAPWRRLSRLSQGSPSSADGEALPTSCFWALKDVSFEVQPGEVIGIIGRNGAGKSTLLKILSRITEPTEGRVMIRGRVGSLLEVGTGFHPELTGRENIALSGAILGMSRREITHKFDEIVAFAEIGRFLDTAVKRYSSGMYVRLAFAVAANLNPDVFLVDEVLAVGDATYQRKCLDRMSALAVEGKTVLFVSHNMDLIPRLCRKAVLLDRGRLEAEGPAGQVVDQYLTWQLDRGKSEDLSKKPRSGDGRARFTRIQMVNANGRSLVYHQSGADLVFRIEVDARCQIADVALAVNLQTISGTTVISGWTREAGFSVDLHKGVQSFRCHFRGIRLRPGHRFTVALWMEAREVVDSVGEALIFEVTDGEDTRCLSTDKHQGVLVADYTWSRS